MADDDYTVQTYQDDLDNDNRPDPFADEVAEDPATELGIPESEFKDELDKIIDDDDEDFGADDVDIEDDERDRLSRLDESIEEEDPDDRGY
jgi:hypothetical protein